MLYKGVAISLFLITLFGCASMRPRQNLDPSFYYKKDMIVEVNGQEGEGVLVIPESEKLDFYVQARGDLDLFTLTTCHREWTKEKAWNVKRRNQGLGWVRRMQTNEIKFDITPNGVEKTSYCPIDLGGYEEQKGRHSWALIDIKGKDTTLPAQVTCNGEYYRSEGVSMCQSRETLIQAIKFESEVFVAPDPECDLGKNKGSYFEFPIKLGKCVYLFREAKKPHRDHRLTTYGYEKILIRK